ncbi:MAG: PucR family transcriptional regulator ligand-binding domain-containing protein [Pseudobutyrivibrio sp.]|nr:PucR family transcriptional regulator ligand-binding domain-containing protein [Pseudobutyrivibrio sp.]
MGYTVEDLLIVARDRYQMKLVAGTNGWANSISWMLMVEDTTICRNFNGKELAVTTGLGFSTEESLLELVEILDNKHASGLIINTGYYIKDIPQSVIDYCNSRDLPLITSPWDIVMSDMIKDMTVRIFLQSQTDEQISGCFMRAIENPSQQELYRENLSADFDVDGQFQVVMFSTDDLDSMDSLERRRIGYRLQIYLENISHNAHFFYYNGAFLLIFNEVSREDTSEIIEGFLTRVKHRMPDKNIYVGVGTKIKDAYNIRLSYNRASYALTYAKREQQAISYFDDMGLYRLIYTSNDDEVLYEMGENAIAPVLEHDAKHSMNLEETLFNYLKYDGSISKVSSVMYIHKNTIAYRMNKIRELLGTDIDSMQEKTNLYIACLIHRGRA